MNLFFSLILLILTIFLIFFIRYSNKDFYDKYLFFLDKKENILNIFILIVFSFVSYQMHYSKEFYYYFDNIFTENLELKILLFLVFTILVIKYLDTNFFKTYYLFKFYNIFFLLLLLSPILYKVSSYNDEYYRIFFIFSFFIFLWIAFSVFKFKKENLLKMLVIPFLFFIVGLGSIFYCEKNINDKCYYMEILENYSKDKMPHSRIFKISKLEFEEAKFIRMIFDYYSSILDDEKREEVLKKYGLDVETQLGKMSKQNKMVTDILFSFLYGDFGSYNEEISKKILIALSDFNKLKTIKEKDDFLEKQLSGEIEEYFDVYFEKVTEEQHNKYIEILSREYSEGILGYFEFLQALRREIK